jgi:hypothetical protein
MLAALLTGCADFSDIHVLPGCPFDAFIFGIRANPEEAYRYAKGEPIKHPAGYDMQLARPLDFQAVTDHAIAQRDRYA